MNLTIIRKKRFYTFKFFIPITLKSEPKELDSDIFFIIKPTFASLFKSSALSLFDSRNGMQSHPYILFSNTIYLNLVKIDTNYSPSLC